MESKVFSTNELRGKQVYDSDGGKKIGKVRSFVFHPRRRLVVGFNVKRPDVAWMFHRKDLFVSFDSFEYREGKLFVVDDQATTGKSACSRLGISWDDCLIWQGMPLVTEDGQKIGHVGNVFFDASTGEVTQLSVDQGASRNALLGVSRLDASCVLGFEFGAGENLDVSHDGDFEQGALIVSSEALEAQRQGGLAEKAGEATAVAGHKVSQVVDSAKPKLDVAADKMRDAADEAKQKAGEAKERMTEAAKERPSGEEMTKRAASAIEDGGYRLGEQMGKARGMFSSFKENYKRAMEEDEADD